MSSHEHRFRLFSSVEYEGQLYMTPQNFIESVTMSEPRSTYEKIACFQLFSKLCLLKTTIFGAYFICLICIYDMYPKYLTASFKSII